VPCLKIPMLDLKSTQFDGGLEFLLVVLQCESEECLLFENPMPLDL
jgi:hypothetical protein